MFFANCSIVWSAFFLITAPPNSPSRPPMFASVSTDSSVSFGDSSRTCIVIFARTAPPIRLSEPSAVIAARPACSSASTIVITPSSVTEIGPTRCFTVPLYLLSPSASTLSTPGMHLPTRGMSIRNSHSLARGAATVILWLRFMLPPLAVPLPRGHVRGWRLAHSRHRVVHHRRARGAIGKPLGHALHAAHAGRRARPAGEQRRPLALHLPQQLRRRLGHPRKLLDPLVRPARVDDRPGIVRRLARHQQRVGRAAP